MESKLGKTPAKNMNQSHNQRWKREKKPNKWNVICIYHKREAEVEELINIEEEGKQAGPTNPEYEVLKLDLYNLSLEEKIYILTDNW